MILFGLAGGLGNGLFALPALKKLSRLDSVALYVEDDYSTAELWSRCRYATRVYGRNNTLPRAAQYLAGQYIPGAMLGLPVQRCGWPEGTSNYKWPEWDQIARLACGSASAEDVTDWCEIRSEKEIDFALIPGGKPGDEWSRKKWPGFYQLALALENQRYSVEAFGLRYEIDEAKLRGWWQGPRAIQNMPDVLARCRVAVTNDCGIGHLASSLGIPTVMIFTATSPVKGRPMGPHRIIARGCERMPRGCQSTEVWRECAKWVCREIPVEEAARAGIDFLPKPIGESVP